MVIITVILFLTQKFMQNLEKIMYTIIYNAIFKRGKRFLSTYILSNTHCVSSVTSACIWKLNAFKKPQIKTIKRGACTIYKTRQRQRPTASESFKFQFRSGRSLLSFACCIFQSICIFGVKCSLVYKLREFRIFEKNAISLLRVYSCIRTEFKTTFFQLRFFPQFHHFQPLIGGIQAQL